jgi:hypothetical protein
MGRTHRFAPTAEEPVIFFKLFLGEIMHIQKKKRGLPFFLLTTAIMVFPAWSSAATLHAILVVDTNDKDIGRSVDLDLGRMGKLLQSIEDAIKPELTLNYQRIAGHDLESGQGYDNVTHAVNNLSVGPEDVVIFYYSGHGMSEIPPWPSMGVEGRMGIDKLLPLSWVVTALKEKNPRFFIAMVDACNTLPPPRRQARVYTKEIENPTNYQKLFLGFKGMIIASSSTPGQASFGHPSDGGLFTTAFLKSLNQELSTSTTNPNWNEVMERAKEPIPTNEPKQPTQQPQAKVDVKPVDFNSFTPEPVDEHTSPMCFTRKPKPDRATGTCETAKHYEKCDKLGKVVETCCTDKFEREICWAN